MLRDIQFGLKMLWKDRAYAGTALLTLAVCIGANTAAFTIVHSVLLKPLPVPDSDRILLMSNEYPKMGATTFGNSSAPDYYDRLRGMNVYEEQAMYDTILLQLDIHGSPKVIQGVEANPSLFRLLKVRPLAGRIFDENEGTSGNELKVILSYGLWQDLFGGNPAVIGRQVRMGARLRTIVGVMPRGFEFVYPEARFWTPLVFTDEQRSDAARHQNGWSDVGRLKPRATMQQAQQQVNAINATNLERFPKIKEILINAGFYTHVERLQDSLVSSIRGTLYVLWAGAAFVLLIGAVNIANLALARSNLRMREFSTRLAIGASRIQLARQVIIESVLLAFTGGVIGIAAGVGILRALATIGLDHLPRANEIHMDLTVIGAALAVSVIAGVLIGMVPVAHLLKVNLSAVLQEDSRTGTQGRTARATRRVLVVAQVAFAFVLLLGSSLLIASFRNLLATDPGFKADGVVTTGIWISDTRAKDDAAVRQFTDRLLEAIRSIPGVTAAGGTTNIPLSGRHNDEVVLAEGYPMKPGESVVNPMQMVITPGFFEAMRTPLLRGRFFNEHDNETAPLAVIVDERLAGKFWPGADPIGKRMYIPADTNDYPPNKNTKWLTVVGVVHEMRVEDLSRLTNFGAIYLPEAQNVQRGLSLTIKTAGDAASVVTALRAKVHGLDPEMLLNDVQPMNDYVAAALMPRRAVMLLATSFGIVSLFLAAIGIYGLLAFLVTQRLREIGIRIALGSTAARIFTLILHEGLLLFGLGVLLGILGAGSLEQFLQSQLYGLAVMDPTIIGLAVLLFAAIALAACSIPARRATQVDPVTVLSLH